MRHDLQLFCSKCDRVEPNPEYNAGAYGYTVNCSICGNTLAYKEFDDLAAIVEPYYTIQLTGKEINTLTWFVSNQLSLGYAPTDARAVLEKLIGAQ